MALDCECGNRAEVERDGRHVCRLCAASLDAVKPPVLGPWRHVSDEFVRTVWQCPVCRRYAYYAQGRVHRPACLGDEEGSLAGQTGPGRAHANCVDMDYVRTEVRENV